MSISAYFCIIFIWITFVRLLSKKLISLSQVEVDKSDIIIIIIVIIINVYNNYRSLYILLVQIYVYSFIPALKIIAL